MAYIKVDSGVYNEERLTIARRKLSKRDSLQSAKQSEEQNAQNRSLPIGSL
jgi:hypothetical protein